MRPSVLLALLISFAALPLSLADVEIITPKASTRWVGGSTVEMTWKDNGKGPALDEFLSFSVYLCWGSNDVPMCDQVLGPAGAKFSAASTSTKFLVPAAAGGNGKNVYFVRMETVAIEGGFTWNYSPRFTLTNMLGAFTAAALAEQEKGDIAPPPARDTTADEVPAVAVEARVPYAMQTGPTRYAPMQTQPGKKITAKSASRQFPTSSYRVFTTKGPAPNVVTTITQTWDYKVTSKENTASPAPSPEDPMQRYLNRWKD